MYKTTTPKNYSYSTRILGGVTYVLTLLPYLLGTSFILQGLGYAGFNWVSVPTYIGAWILHLLTIFAVATVINSVKI